MGVWDVRGHLVIVEKNRRGAGKRNPCSVLGTFGFKKEGSGGGIAHT